MTLLFIYFDEINRFNVVDELNGTILRPRQVEAHRAGRRLGHAAMDVELRVRRASTSKVHSSARTWHSPPKHLDSVAGRSRLSTPSRAGRQPEPHWLVLSLRHTDVDAASRSHAGAGGQGRRLRIAHAALRHVHGACGGALLGWLWAAASGKASAFENAEQVMRGRPYPTDETIEIVTAFCTYVHENYGRFPAFIDPMFVRLVFQAHDLDWWTSMTGSIVEIYSVIAIATTCSGGTGKGEK